MSPLAWGVIAIILVLVGVKNIDKIMELIRKIKNKSQQKTENNYNEPIELRAQDIQEARKDKMQYLLNEKEKRIQEIERLERSIESEKNKLKHEIKDIDIEIYLLQEQKGEQKKKSFWK